MAVVVVEYAEVVTSEVPSWVELGVDVEPAAPVVEVAASNAEADGGAVGLSTISLLPKYLSSGSSAKLQFRFMSTRAAV